MAKKQETKFKERIRPFLDSLPKSWWLKTQMLAILGIPDFLGCLQGYFIAMELKVDGKAPTALQRYVLKKIRDAGGIALHVHPENWEDVYKLLKDVSSGTVDLRDAEVEEWMLSS